MTKLSNKIIAAGFAATIGAVAFAAPAFAQNRGVQYDSQMYSSRSNVLVNADSGQIGPNGERAEAGCYWSRIQIPVSGGLKWVVEETCPNGTGR